jgi:hypothetical protein
MSKRADFKVKDRVWHESRRALGTVERNGEIGLMVRFEDFPKSLACFDDDWFRINPTLLRHAEPTDETS